MPIKRRRITLPGVKPIQEAKPGYELKFLPPYSPELNPVERLW